MRMRRERCCQEGRLVAALHVIRGQALIRPLQGISLSIEQYNTLLAAAPLIEALLAKKGEKTVRPDYSSAPAAKAEEEEEEQAEKENDDNKDEDEDEEDEE
jgi:hypothetical protein